MLNISNITNYRINKDNKNEQERKTYHQVMEQLNFFDKRRLSKIDSLIYGILKTIKTDSHWEYTYPGTFTYLSDFHFDYERQEIKYVINKLEADEEGYHLRDNPTEKERSFFTKYQEFLKKLFKLEQKKKAIYDAHTPQYEDNVIPFDQIVTREQRIKNNKEKNMITGFTQEQMNQFIIKYHTEGIRRLIILLNELDNTDKPYNLLNKLRIELSSEYLETLLEWAATYTTKAQYLLEKIAEERMNRFYQIAGMPSYEDRMTDNITKLL